MEMPWLSLTGLYNHDSSILDNLQLPTAADYAAFAADYPDMIVSDPFVPVKADLVNYMLFALAELPLVYTDPDFVKTMIGYWSAIKAPAFKQIYRTLLYRYNPIWNKDGKVTETRNITFSRNGENTGTGTVTTDGETTSTGTVGRQGSSSGSAEHQVTGFDTNSYSPDKRDLNSSTANETTTNNLAGTEDSTVSSQTAGTNEESGESEDVFTRTEQGNIGVTTSQMMIKEQREIASFNFYEYVTNEFKREFCVAVW